MSDSMERDKIELLTSKEREEEEEMKRELLDMKMYETWYTYKDMKEILGFINESKDMANMANDEKNAQKELMQSSSNCSSEMMLKTNLIQELEIQEHINNTSQSIHSHKSNHTSPIHERTLTHDCNSDLASAIVDSRNSVYRGKNLDNEDIFIKSQDNSNMRDNYSHNMSRYISLKLKNSSQDSDIINNSEKKMDIYSECDKKLDQWQINPLDSCVSENDVPLQEPNRPVVQDRMPFRLCKDAQTPEMLEKLLPALNFYLKQTAELWHSWHRTTDTKFQWGSPIQVGVTKDNLDKKSVTNIKTEQNEMECINKYSNERPNKRKSTMIFSLSDAIYSSSDEDEYTTKKKKIQSYEDKNKELSLNKMIYIAKCNEKNKNLNHDNISKLFDNKEIEHFKMEYKKESKDCLPSELLSLCPKKIIPQIRKNINKNIKHIINMSPNNSIAHSSNEKKNVVNLISKDKNNILTDEEILIELEKDNKKAKTTFENIEIKPLPIKNFSYRIKNECITLEKLQLEKQKKIEIEREKAQKKKIEEKKKKEELYKKQIEEEQKREKQREEKEKDKEEKNKRWNIIYMKSKKKISKKDEEKLLSINKQNKISIDDNRLLEDENTSKINEIEITDNNLSNNINCPICNKSFPNDKIEVHAAGCEQYISENEYENDVHLLESKSLPIAINNPEILECGVCSKYKTTNGIHYEEHVNTCLQRQHEEESLNEYSSNEFSNIPNSPVRCYRPISEQTDSYIDYRRQFPSNSKTQIYSSRKRKR